eukprot:g3539.t1
MSSMQKNPFKSSVINHLFLLGVKIEDSKCQNGLASTDQLSNLWKKISTAIALSGNLLNRSFGFYRVALMLCVYQTYGILQVGWLLARPHMATLLPLLHVLRRVGGSSAVNKSMFSLRSIFNTFYLALAIVQTLADPVIFKDFYKTRPGLYLGHTTNEKQPSQLVKAICQTARLKEKGQAYSSPQALWNGDLQTIVPAILAKVTDKILDFTSARQKNSFRNQRPVVYTRGIYAPAVNNDSAGGDELILDWAFPPTKQATKQDVVLVLPGIGSDSSAHYVTPIVQEFTQKGYICCVLSPKTILDVFDPNGDPRDVRIIIDLIIKLQKQIHLECDTNKEQGKILLVGGSLGGMLIAQYFSSLGSALPPEVLGGLAFSGALGMDFGAWS